jgi:hypothetical protein
LGGQEGYQEKGFLMALLENQSHSLASKRVTIETNGFVVAPYFLRKMPHKSKLTKDISSKEITSTFGCQSGPLSTPTTNPVTADLRVGCRKVKNDTLKF